MRTENLALPLRNQEADGPLPVTLTEAVTDRMIDDIVHGRLHPGSKLRIDQLKRRYKMGASPLREALTRMVALGFVTNEARKGFQVSNMSHEDIQDITQVRKLFETRALEISIANGGKDWEEQVVIQMARLRHAVRRNSAGYDPLDAASDRIHRDYHRALISGCGSPRLLELQDTYYDLAKRYRVLVFQSLATPAEFLERHEILTDIVLSKKVGEACGELGRHLDLIVSTLPGLSGDIVVHGPGQVKPRKPKAQSLAS